MRSTLERAERIAQKTLAMDGSLERERDESGLIGKICQGQTELFHTLIKPYERTVFAVAYSVMNNGADAEDVAQEAFLNALKGLKSFRAEAKFSTWLIQIAFNEARMRLRRSRTQAHQSLDEIVGNEQSDDVPRDFADWREIPSEALARKELRQIMEKTLQSLRAIYREVLILRDVQGLTTAETSQVLSVTEDVVKTRLRRARLQMREALAPGYDGSWTSESKVYKSVRPW